MNFLNKVLTKDGCAIHYWITYAKDRPWLIFLHGAGADHNMFNDQIEEMDESFNVLLWDARGHGLSRPIGEEFSLKMLMEDLKAIMSQERIQKATFIGQSMGGNLAQEMAFHYPEMVDNLVLIDCTCNTMELSIAEKTAIWMAPFIMKLCPGKWLLPLSANASSVKKDVQQYLKSTFYRIGKNDFTTIFLATTKCLHAEKDYFINKPMLLVCGELDKTGNIKKIARRWASRETQCEFHWIPDAGHCANQDNPVFFNKLLLQFLRKQCTI